MLVPLDKQKVKIELFREYYKRSLYEFVKDAWSSADSSDFKDNWHIKLICDNLQERYFQHVKGEEGKDILINLPPGSSKTMIISVIFPMWIWLHDHHKTILNLTYNHTIALDIARKRLKLFQSEFYKQFNHQAKRKETDQEILLMSGGRIFSTSVNSAITGMHFSIVIVDDGNGPLTPFSFADRERTKEYIFQILPSRKTDPKTSYTIYVQQRMHYDDISGYLIRNHSDRIKHIVIPAIKDGESFFPDRFPLDVIETFRIVLGDKSFNAQYQQITSLEQSNTIKQEWVNFNDFEIPVGTKLTWFLDTAYGVSAGDYNALVGCYIKDNTLYVTKCFQNKNDFPDLIQFLKDNILSQSTIYIEGKASGKSVIQTLQKETNYNIIEMQPKGSKKERKETYSLYFRSNRIVFDSNIENKQDIYNQLTNDVLVHDDIMDVILYAIEYMLVETKGTNTIVINGKTYTY